MAIMLLFFLLAASSQAASALSLKPHCRVNCLSWRVANEANNTVGWDINFPIQCKEYIKHYLLGHQYRDDSEVVIDEAIQYIQNLPLPKDGRNIWIFDIDETVLSNVQFFIDHVLELDSDLYSVIRRRDWVHSVKQQQGSALPESKRLYDELVNLGVKIVFLTGRAEDQREDTINNLVAEGFGIWEKLILKSDKFVNETAKVYKSTIRGFLEERFRYRIVGNIGDQWSDISGSNPGRRTFKLPNPMYYIA